MVSIYSVYQTGLIPAHRTGTEDDNEDGKDDDDDEDDDLSGTWLKEGHPASTAPHHGSHRSDIFTGQIGQKQPPGCQWTVKGNCPQVSLQVSVG